MRLTDDANEAANTYLTVPPIYEKEEMKAVEYDVEGEPSWDHKLPLEPARYVHCQECDGFSPRLNARCKNEMEKSSQVEKRNKGTVGNRPDDETAQRTRKERKGERKERRPTESTGLKEGVKGRRGNGGYRESGDRRWLPVAMMYVPRYWVGVVAALFVHRRIRIRQ